MRRWTAIPSEETAEQSMAAIAGETSVVCGSSTRPRRRHLRREEKSVLGSPLSFFFLLSVLFPLPHIICAHEMRARMTRTDSYGLRYSILWYPFFLVRATTNVMQKRRRNDKKDQTHIQKNKNDACKRIDASPSTSNRHLPFLSKST